MMMSQPHGGYGHDGLGYGPPLLTERGIVAEYDPLQGSRSPDYSPGPVEYSTGSTGFTGSTGSTGLDYGPGAYNPESTHCEPRPPSPTYAPFSDSEEEDVVMHQGDSHEHCQDDSKFDPDIDENTKPVRHLLFRPRSPEEIRRLSAVVVTTDKVSFNGEPVKGGLQDPRFGCSGGRPCGTCGAHGDHSSSKCNGHFGSYELSCPLYNVAYNKVVIMWLRLVCGQCGHVHVEEEEIARGKPVRSFLKSVPSKCEKCEAVMRRSVVWKASAQTMVETSTEETITAADALEIFRKVPDQHPVFEFAAHPRCMITTVLFVPSIVVRPAVGGTEEGESPRGQSDLTYRLVKIIRADLLLKKKLSETNDWVSRESALLGLQNAYSGYVDSRQCYRKKSKPSQSANGTDTNQQSQYKCLREMFVSKSGWVRNNVLGKRVDHACRGVIAPFEGAHPTWLGVPKFVAEKMTVPLKVTSNNKDAVRRMIREKKAAFLTKSNGERVDLRMHPDPGPLEVGWTVDRHLKDGDVVLFNRQPTLSKRSFLSFKIKIQSEDRVFRLCLANTGAFNADFDGDEMNLHVPQTLRARAEAEELMCVDHSVINSADGQASVLNVQGDRLASYKMSDDSTLLDRDTWFACLGTATDDMIRRAMERPPESFPCKASLLWSLALPDDYNWTKGDVCISNGKLVSGRIRKKQLALLVHDVWADRGPKAALDFVHCVHLVSGAYNSIVQPTTLRLSEFSSSAKLEQDCESIIHEEYQELRSIQASKHATKAMVEEAADMHMSRATRRMTELVFKTDTCRHTGFRDLVESGAKGSRVNFAMVRGGLGKMLGSEDTKGVFASVENTTLGRRSFTHTKSRDIFHDGYVRSGYAKGMSVSEYCIHSKAGRRGLISSSNMVSSVGYQFRRLYTTLGSLITWGGSVRDTSSDAIVSWKYGDDGRSPFFVEKETLAVPATPMGIPQSLLDSMSASLCADTDRLKAMLVDPSSAVDMPLSLRRILHDARCRFKPPPGSSQERLKHACSGVAELERLCGTHGTYFGEKLECWLRVHLHPFALWGLPREGVAAVMEEVDKRLWKSRVEDGETVGFLCASSLSQKSTQVTLDSFHNIGSESGANFSELEEVINQNKSRKYPKITFRLKEDLKETVEKWVEKHRRVTLADVVREKSSPREEDHVVLQSYWSFPDDENETAFEPAVRLEISTSNPFGVRLALESVGCRRLAYAKLPNGHYLFHSSHDVSESQLESTVVSGVFANLSVSREGAGKKVVTCSKMTLKQVEEFSEAIKVTSWYTNNFQSTLRLLGIEAARALVVRSLTSLMEKFNITLSLRHINLLADKMSHTGRLLGCTRHGMKMDNPKGRYMQRAAFEQPVDNLMRAAAERGKDQLKGPLARQAFGQTVFVGTNHPWMEMRTDVAFAKKNAVYADSHGMDLESDLDFGEEGADSWIPQQTPAEPYYPDKRLKHDPWAPNPQFVW